MATPMSADQFLAALKAEGLRISEHAGWRTHNRAGHGAWGPMNGVMIHHTAGSAPGDGNVVWSGRSDLPGPLAHGYLAKTGTVTMTANGRANHAGGGDPAVLAAVINETYVTAPPAPKFHDGSGGAADGNAHFYGLEISNLGTSKDSYPAVQYEAAVKWAAAICRHHGWSSKSVIGHKEWSDWKSDPSFDIKMFRRDVATALALKAGAWKLHPATTTPKGTTVLTDAQTTSLYNDLMKIGSIDGDGTHAAGWFLAHTRHDALAAFNAVVELTKMVVDLQASVNALKKP